MRFACSRFRRWRHDVAGVFHLKPSGLRGRNPAFHYTHERGKTMLKKIGVAVIACAPLAAFAAVPAAITTAITDLQADAITVATAMVGVTAALLVFRYIRRQLH